MLALAMATGVEVAMSNHFYTFGGKIRKQSSGGAIGAELTGEISRDVMGLWDSRFLDRVRKLGIKLEIYKRYVDDDLIVCPPIIPGWYYDKKSNLMIYSKDLANSDTDESDVRTAKVLNQIANKLEPNI